MLRQARALSSAAAGAVLIAATVVALASPATLHSGVDKGAMLPAYSPRHVTGEDRDTSTCPVCKYPFRPAVQAWVNTDDAKNVTALVTALERVTRANADKKLKAFVVFVPSGKQSADALAKRLARLGEKGKLRNVALTYVSGPDDPALKGYGINTDARVRNTIFVYRDRKVSDKFVNLVADREGIDALTAAIRRVL